MALEALGSKSALFWALWTPRPVRLAQMDPEASQILRPRLDFQLAPIQSHLVEEQAMVLDRSSDSKTLRDFCL